jgi:phosphate transport system substrate-binding protein
MDSWLKAGEGANMRTRAVSALILGVVALFPKPSVGQLDSVAMLNAIEPYQIPEQVKGEVHVIGSGTMARLAELCITSLKQYQPQITLKTTAGGSEEGIKKVAAEPGSMASVTRPVEEGDFQLLKKEGLKKPTAIIVGIDPLSVFVHKDNPLKEVSIPDLKRLFGEAPEGGRANQWGQLGITGAWANRPVHAQIRGENSGTRTFTDRYILQGTVSRKDAKEHNANQDMFKAVEADEGSVTIAPIYLKSDKVQPLAIRAGDKAVAPEPANIISGAYRLVRPVLWIFDGEGKNADVNKQFLKFVLSREGQLEVIKAGYYPLSPVAIQQQRNLLGLKVLR